MPDSSPRKKRAVPCAAQGLAAAAELALRAQTILADNSASPFRCSARQTGGKRALRAAIAVQWRKVEVIAHAGENGAPSAPAGAAQSQAGCAGRDSRRSADKAGCRISTCPTPVAVPLRAEFAEVTETILAQLGRAFFAYFLCTSKESEVPAGAQTGTLAVRLMLGSTHGKEHNHQSSRVTRNTSSTEVLPANT